MKKYTIGFVLIFLLSCVEDFDHKNINTTTINPDISEKTEITFQQLFDLHSNEIGRDTLVTGYVVSTDQQGNFYKEIYIQNTQNATDLGNDNPRMGLRVRVGLSTTSTKYAKGRKVAINLEGLKRTVSDDLLTIGKPSNTYIKDISEFDLDTHILKFDEIATLIPKATTIAKLTTKDLNTLVSIENVHFKSSQVGMVLAGLPTDDFDGKRTLMYCEIFRRDTILLETSNFSDFASEEIPNYQMDVQAIYSINFDDEPVLVLNQFQDLSERGSYVDCNTKIPNVLMTEIADPENASFSRFVELYNHENVAVDLKGWSLIRYNNGTSESKISLSGLVVQAKGFLIIANNKESTSANLNFKDAFGREPSLTNSQLDGNGNDAYALVNENEVMVDVFGEVAIDGSGQEWEYTDGRAYRNVSVTKPNSGFNLEEWIVIKDHQEAPVDFSPFERTSTETPILIQTAPLLLTEIADPKEEVGARFVEIYNATGFEVPLKNWSLVRYNYTTAKNTKTLAALPMSLDALSIPAKGFLVIAKNQLDFETYFGMSPDATFTNLDGNGDDAYELIDPFGNVVDVFGNPNSDGTGEDWEYTDGVGVRKETVTEPNAEFELNEWEIQKSQEGSSGYSPGMR
ncbi:DUF5689 domain-containing protein [Wenyingzhuangia sp. 1_MG-2023]|nr:DUF5689 domain-containing protein [Wenyingzhuangia sp. 1_MG-2023]